MVGIERLNERKREREGERGGERDGKSKRDLSALK